MNRIKALLDQSDFEFYSDFLNFNIDDYWLDEKLDEIYPNNLYKGLIPTLVNWIDGEVEKKIVWNRILPIENQITICPILMCPDDNDFSCTLILAEIENCNNFIKWKRLGIDKTQDWNPENVGSVVEWFDKISSFYFSKTEYMEMLEQFKVRMSFEEFD